jgi:hypothetical protein
VILPHLFLREDRLAAVLADIQTDNLVNKDPQYYHYNSLLGQVPPKRW